MQLIATIISVLLVGLFTLHMTQGIRTTQNEMWQNEVMTQVTGLGQDVLEHILRRPYDENSDESKIFPLNYPVITTPTQFTDEASFGGCTTLDLVDPTCDDVDDFDGLDLDMTVAGFPFNVVVNVQYVDPDDPSSPTGTKTTAKEVSLTISTPMLQIGGNDIEMTLSRVATYNRHMTAP